MTEAKTPARRPAAKKPQDHKPKAAPEEDRRTRIRKIEVDGVKLDATIEFMYDFEFVEAMADVDEGQLQMVPRMLKQAINDRSAYQRVKEHLRDENGRIDLARGAEFFHEFMEAVQATVAAEDDEPEQ